MARYRIVHFADSRPEAQEWEVRLFQLDKSSNYASMSKSRVSNFRSANKWRRWRSQMPAHSRLVSDKKRRRNYLRVLSQRNPEFGQSYNDCLVAHGAGLFARRDDAGSGFRQR